MSVNELSGYAKATVMIYGDCIKLASKDLVRNWVIILGTVLLSFVFFQVKGLLSSGGPLSGFVLGMLYCIMLSLYYNWLSQTIDRDTLRFNELFVFNYSMFSAVISVAFIFFIAHFLIGNLIQGAGINWVMGILDLGILVVFNPIAEVLHVHRYESMPALEYAANFARDNLFEWMLPFVILLLPGILESGEGVLFSLASTDVLLPVTPIIMASARFFVQYVPIPYSIAPHVALVFGVVIGCWFMLFRAHLFKQLESGTRRQRAYKMRAR